MKTMPKLFLGTSEEDRREFHRIMDAFKKANHATGDLHIDELEAWIERLAQNCFEVGQDSAKIWERNE